MQSTKTTKVSTLFIAASMLAFTGFSSCDNGDSKTVVTTKTDSPAVITTAPVKMDTSATMKKMDSLKLMKPASDSPKLKKANLRPIVPNS